MGFNDVVDVHLDSITHSVDAILQDPLLDGNKKYTAEISEFSCSLSGEPPLQESNDYLLRVRRRKIGAAVDNDITLLTNVPADGGGITDLAQNFLDTGKDRFVTKQGGRYPVSCIQDLVQYLQFYFDEIKKNYVMLGDDNLPGGEYGSAADDTLENNDRFVVVSLTANRRLRLSFGIQFQAHFYLQLSLYAQKLFGFEYGDFIGFRVDGEEVLSGMPGLTDGGNILVAGGTNDTIEVNGEYSLDVHFEHRIRIEIETAMPIPNTIVWNTDNTQKISKVIGSFPIISRNGVRIRLNNISSVQSEISSLSMSSTGNVVFRRAEDRISERYEILNSQFFQQILLKVFITRKKWVQVGDIIKYIFTRTPIRLIEGGYWTAKLRFRTL